MGENKMATLTFGLILVCLYLGYKVLSLAKEIGEYDFGLDMQLGDDYFSLIEEANHEI